MFSSREVKIEDNDNESAIAPETISYDYDIFKSEISNSPGQENEFSSPTQQMSTSKFSCLYFCNFVWFSMHAHVNFSYEELNMILDSCHDTQLILFAVTAFRTFTFINKKAC